MSIQVNKFILAWLVTYENFQDQIKLAIVDLNGPLKMLTIITANYVAVVTILGVF